MGVGWGGGYSLYRIVRPSKSKLTKQKKSGRNEWGRGWGGGYSLYRIVRPSKSKLTKQKESGRRAWGWGEGGGGGGDGGGGRYSLKLGPRGWLPCYSSDQNC